MKAKRAIRATERGLTLIEIMIVLIILGIVMGWLGTKLIGAGDKAKIKISQIKMQELKQYIEQYQLQNNALPNSLEDLATCPANANFCTPVTNEEGLKDAWGNQFSYSLENGGRGYRIKCQGADQKEGGDGTDADFFLTGP